MQGASIALAKRESTFVDYILLGPINSNSNDLSGVVDVSIENECSIGRYSPYSQDAGHISVCIKKGRIQSNCYHQTKAEFAEPYHFIIRLSHLSKHHKARYPQSHMPEKANSL